MNDRHRSTTLVAQRLRPLAACLAAGFAAQTFAAPPHLDLLHRLSAEGRVELPPGLVERIETGWPAAPATTRVVTNCDDSGAGSLRDAVVGAAEGDTVDLTQVACSRITLTSGAVPIGVHNLAIEGPGSNRLAIDGNHNENVFHALNNGTLSIEGLTLENGFKYNDQGDAFGGCVYSLGNVILRDVHLQHCEARAAVNPGGPSFSALGGGIWTRDALLLYDSIVSENTAQAMGNGYASGGGIYAHGAFISTYSTISSNVAIGHSSTPSFGGGALTWYGGLVAGASIWGNTSTRMAGLALYGSTADTMTIVNSTVSGNDATRFGGVFARTVLNLYNSTIAFNHSTEWTDGTTYWAAGLFITSGLGNLDSTIINNNVNDAAPFATADLTGAAGSGFTGGHNNVGLCGTPCPNDTTHDDPGLHPLQDNGGRSRTHVPTPGIWDTFGGTNLLGFQWDQRGPGFPRQSPGDFPEIGALQINSDIIFANGFN